MKSDRPLPVAIIGGGFSGTVVAAQLARRGIDSLLIEPGAAGLGAAYSTSEPAHLLNVRASNMSAWADDPAHFARFAAEHGVAPDGFAERRLFGRYVRHVLSEAGECVQVATTKAVGARPDEAGWTVTLDDGAEATAAALVLATGNQPPEPIRGFEAAGDRFIANPWSEAARRAIATAAEQDSPVLLVGTGLTMVDVALSLNAAGHRGPIVAVSRRGLLPRAHADGGQRIDAGDVPEGDLVGLTRWLRRKAAEAGWRGAVDSLRSVTQTLWQALSPDQQRRFLRHARPWWDVHRHRIAPEVARQIRGMIEQGRLEVLAGRIGHVGADGEGLKVRLARRGGGSAEREVACAFNCTGPLGNIARSRDPLLRQMLDDGLVAPDQLGIGIEVDDRSRTGERLWAVGPPTRGKFWEIVAVPDIRVQAEAVAKDIAEELGR